MDIAKAMTKALKIHGVLFHAVDEMWEEDNFHMRVEPGDDTCYLQTIASPELCPVHVKAPDFRVPGWMPSARDILSDDWEVETMEEFKKYATKEYLDLVKQRFQES